MMRIVATLAALALAPPAFAQDASVAADVGHRAARARLLAQQPALEEEGETARLANDPVPEVAFLGLLALSRSASEEAEGLLLVTIESPDASTREAGAISLLIRDALVEPLVGEVLERARSQVVTETGAAWLRAIEAHRDASEATRRWLDAHDRLAQLSLAERECSSAIAANRALGEPTRDDGSDAYSTFGSGAARTELVRVRPVDDTPTALLMGGRLGALEESAWQLRDQADRLEAEGTALELICSRARDGIAIDSATPPPSMPREDSLEFRFALGLGIDSNPFAFRGGATDEFVPGEEIELTFVPELGLTWLRIPDLMRFEATVGGFVSNRLFEDRSRPTAGLRFLAEDRLLVDVGAALSAGVGDVWSDPTYAAAPAVLGHIRLGHLDRDDGSSEVVQRFEGRLRVAEHVLDDRSVALRDRRWLEPGLTFRQLFALDDATWHVGFSTDGSVRSNGDLGDPDAFATSALAIVRLTRPALEVEATLGVGLAAPVASLDDRILTPAGGVRAVVRHNTPNALRLSLALEGGRRVDPLGRLGLVGARNRAEGRFGIAFASAMRDPISIAAVLDRTRSEGGVEQSWGGLELSIPITLLEIDQEISYRMRYFALTDGSRLGSRSTELFEAVLTAGMRF